MTEHTCQEGVLCRCKIDCAITAMMQGAYQSFRQPVRLVTPRLAEHAAKVHPNWIENWEHCMDCYRIVFAPMI